MPGLKEHLHVDDVDFPSLKRQARAPLQSPRLANLGLPPIVEELISGPNGLFLVCGPHGSGKSWTLAAMVEHLHQRKGRRTLMLERYSQFEFRPVHGMVSYREINHPDQWGEALALAEDGNFDTVVLEELDRDQLESAIRLSERGKLVLAGMTECQNTTRTYFRLLDLLPYDCFEPMMERLAEASRGSLHQQLVPRLDGSGLVLAAEIFNCTPYFRGLLAEGLCHELNNSIQTRHQLGMQTLEQSLLELVLDKIIDPEKALSASYDPIDLQRMLDHCLERKRRSGGPHEGVAASDRHRERRLR